MKYIIKNCPCLYILRDMDLICKDTQTEQKECHLIPDCLLKRVAEACKEIIKQRQEIDFDNIWGHSYSDNELSELNGRCKMARKILNLLEIEEANE